VWGLEQLLAQASQTLGMGDFDKTSLGGLGPPFEANLPSLSLQCSCFFLLRPCRVIACYFCAVVHYCILHRLRVNGATTLYVIILHQPVRARFLQELDPWPATVISTTLKHAQRQLPRLCLRLSAELRVLLRKTRATRSGASSSRSTQRPFVTASGTLHPLHMLAA
jgi:hypothetical protein